jgi:release factor glutamine methyltransferase
MLTIQKLLKQGYDKLKNSKSPNLDVEVILSYVLNKPREYILTHLDEEMPLDVSNKFEELIDRRKKHEPVAYLINNKEFYGRNFFVDNRVHIPRPATEDLINLIKGVLSAKFKGTIADIGTGSGCISITLALEFLKANIIAIDISEKALIVAKQNADKLKAADRITFLKGDLLNPLTKKVDIIIANLPYGWSQTTRSLGEVWTDDKEIFFQPKNSHQGGKNGLDLIKKLIDELPNYLSKKGQCFLEYDPRQTDEITDYLQKTNFKFDIIKDSATHDRILFITNNS